MGRGNREELIKFFQATSWSWLLLLAILAVAAWLILRIRARFRDREDPAAEKHRILTQMRDLHREGGLSDEEYRSIKGRLIDPADHSLRNPGEAGERGEPAGQATRHNRQQDP